jgi:hypothetical protein
MKRLNQQLNFDDEARALWAKLNLDPNSRNTGQWNALDSIYRHPTGYLLLCHSCFLFLYRIVL